MSWLVERLHDAVAGSPGTGHQVPVPPGATYGVTYGWTGTPRTWSVARITSTSTGALGDAPAGREACPETSHVARPRRLRGRARRPDQPSASPAGRTRRPRTGRRYPRPACTSRAAGRPPLGRGPRRRAPLHVADGHRAGGQRAAHHRPPTEGGPGPVSGDHRWGLVTLMGMGAEALGRAFALGDLWWFCACAPRQESGVRSAGTRQRYGVAPEMPSVSDGPPGFVVPSS